MSREIPPEWSDVIRELAAEAAIVILIGASDSGKTAFAGMLAASAWEAGRSVAIVDSDLGQSEIGPPACVGMGLVEGPITLPRECRLRALSFVGSISPRGRMLEHCVGTYRMVASAKAAQSSLCIVDTTGFVIGHTAARLKRAKIDLVRPDYLVALERKGECQAIVSPYRRSTEMAVRELKVPAVVRRKSPEMRALSREGSFASYFVAAEPLVLAMDEVAFAGSWLGGQRPLETREMLYISRTIGAEVLHAELGSGHLGMLAAHSPRDTGRLQEIRERYRVSSITFTRMDELRHLLVGLLDAEGKTLGMGVLEQLDPVRRALTVITPVRARAAVSTVAFGLQRVMPNGKEQGAIRPGSV